MYHDEHSNRHDHTESGCLRPQEPSGINRPGAAPSGGQIQNVQGGPRRLPAWAPLSLRLFLGVVFLYASYDKILHPQDFAETVYHYQILPGGAVNLTALVLPWLELFLGFCLIVGIWLPGTTALSSGLLALFIAALVFNLSRGLDVHCGCFSTKWTDGPADIWTVMRDVGFLVISVYLALRVFRGRSLSKIDRFGACMHQ